MKNAPISLYNIPKHFIKTPLKINPIIAFYRIMSKFKLNILHQHSHKTYDDYSQ